MSEADLSKRGPTDLTKPGGRGPDPAAGVHDGVERVPGAAKPDLTVWPATGGAIDESHTEESFAIVGLSDDEARALGREFEQEAVFAWRESEYVVLACDDDEVMRRGWQVGPT